MKHLWLSLVLCAIIAPSLKAQSLADHVPADAVLYLGWAGTDHMPEGYDKSHLKAVLDASHLRQVFGPFLQRLAMRANTVEPKAGQLVDQVLGLTGPLFSHPTAIYFRDLQFSGRSVTFDAAVVCQADEAADDMERRLTQLKEQAGDDLPLTVSREGGVITMQFGQPTASASGHLDTLDGFKASLGEVGGPGPMIAYINMQALLKIADTNVQNSGNEELIQWWPRVRDGSGLPGLKSICGASNFSGKDWVEQMFIDAPAPRSGLLTLLSTDPLSPEALSIVPKSATFVSAGMCDLSKAIDSIRATATAIDPRGGQYVDQGLGALTLVIGRNFQRDIVGAFGPEWVGYIDPQSMGYGIGGLVLANKTPDPKKADNALTTLAITIANTSATFMNRYGLSVPLERCKIGEVTVSYLGIPLLAPSWAVGGDHLYMGLFPQSVAAAIKFSASKGASIKDEPAFNETVNALNVASPTSVGYVDLHAGVLDSYQTFLVLERLLAGAADMWGVQAPEPVLPMLSDLLAEVHPIASSGWADDRGFHTKAISPFPGAGLLGGGFGLGQVAGVLPQWIAMGMQEYQRSRMHSSGF